MSQPKNPNNNWPAVWALALGVSGIMIGQFLPSGLLTPIADDLNISEGLAGQTVSVTSLIAIFASLMSAYLTQKWDRQKVLLGFTVLNIISCFVVAVSQSFIFILIGRCFLGVAIGGFWSMATATALRLVEEKKVPQALAIVFSSASFSAMLAAPIGSFLGELVGWRSVFLINAGVGFLGLALILFFMPVLKPLKTIKIKTTFEVLKIPTLKTGLLAIILVFCGRFAVTTYLRPYFEQDVNLTGARVSLMFLAFDLSYFVGTLFVGQLVSRALGLSLKLAPLLLAMGGFCLIFSSFSPTLTFIFIVFLGLSFSPIPVSWSTWGAKISPENAETVGGFYVASTQTAAATGALFGGVIFDAYGSSGVFSLGILSWTLSSLLVVLFVKTYFNEHEKKSKLENSYQGV